MERSVISPKILNIQSHEGSGKILPYPLEGMFLFAEAKSCAKHAILEVYRQARSMTIPLACVHVRWCDPPCRCTREELARFVIPEADEALFPIDPVTFEVIAKRIGGRLVPARQELLLRGSDDRR